MQIGLIGLGRMGGNMVERLVERGHSVVGYDLSEESRKRAADRGADTAGSIEELVGGLDSPRAVWVMVPHGDPTRQTLETVLPLLDPDDVLIDGGNSHYTDSVAFADRCEDAGVHFLDAGVSGGVWGLKEGYCVMVGGPRAAFERIQPVLEALAPEGGYALVGPHGAGHFVKMVHNAVEYAMLQGIGEGFELLERAPYDLDLPQVAELWRHGTVIRSWLLDLMVRAFDEEGADLASIAPYVDDSGTGRWSVDYALDAAIPIPVITESLYERFASRLDDRFSARVIAALRNQFGGHPVRKED